MTSARLLTIVPRNGRSDLWISTEWRHGHTVVVLQENETARASNERRRLKPSIAIRAASIPQVRAALEAAEADFRARGLLPQQGLADAGSGKKGRGV